MHELNIFLKSRNEALRSGDLEVLREHLKRFEVAKVEEMSDEDLLIVLHKNRVHWKDCPPELLKESVWWLLEHEYSLDFD